MKKNSNRLVLSSALAVMTTLIPAAAFIACGEGKPAESPTAASASASAAPTDSSAAAAPSAAPAGTVLITDSSVIQKLFDDSAASPESKAKAGGVTGGGPLPKGIRGLAKDQAPG